MLDRPNQNERPSRIESDFNDGAYIEDSFQQELASKRSQKELARLWTTCAWSFVVNLVLACALVLAVFAWRKADDRYANDVRVAWVKLIPNGQSQVEYWDDGGAPNRFFQATVNKSLIDYVEHRYRRRSETIEADYGFALEFMSDNQRAQFLQVYNAPKIAADVSGCGACDQVDLSVRAIDHNTMVSPDRMNAGTTIVESTVYITETTLLHGAAGNDKRNKMVKLTWGLRPVAEITKNLKSLQANPLGLQIISEKEIDDLGQGVSR